MRDLVPYRVRRTVNYFRFHRQIGRLLDTPPLTRRSAPLTIVSLVAGYDVRLYILAMKALYRRLPGGDIVAIIASDVPPSSQTLIRRHLGDVEFVPITSIETGRCQRGGTWERLLYCVDRSARRYVIQMDCDVLCAGPIPEVLDAVHDNRAFALADGIPKKPLRQWVQDGIARNSDNVVTAFEKQALEFPDVDRWLYLRGSSGFAGFAHGAIDREFIQNFHDSGLKVMGSRWREWGTEQVASNFAVANSPGSIGLPKPKYLSYENHENHAIPEEISLLHFLGYCRFNHGVYARFANREIDALLAG